MSKAVTLPAVSARQVTARTKKPRRKSTTITPKQREEEEEGPLDKHWRTYFLQKLAETSNVTASAAYAGAATSRAYKTRREDPQFAAAWRAALLEGYEHLEMEALGYLRNRDPDRKFDIANALRLLAAHKATVDKERARIGHDDHEDDQAVFDSIDAMIDEMRSRSIANDAALTLGHDDDAQDGS